MDLLKGKSRAKLLTSAFVFWLAALGSGCVSVTPVYYEDDKKAVQKKIDEFHQNYNDAKFKQMYELMSAETRKVLSEAEFVKRFEQVYKESGKIIKSAPVKSDVKPQAASRLVTFIYETEFQNGKVEEKFICSTDGKQSFIEVYDQPNKTSPKASQ